MTDIEAQTKKYWLYCCGTCLVLILLQTGIFAIDSKITLSIISLTLKNSTAIEILLVITALTLYFLHKQDNKRNYLLHRKNMMGALSKEKFMIEFIEYRVATQQAKIYKSKIPQIISNSSIHTRFTFNTITHKTNGNGLIAPLSASLNYPIKLYFQVNFFILKHTFRELRNSSAYFFLLMPKLFVCAATVKPVYQQSFKVGTNVLHFLNNA